MRIVSIACLLSWTVLANALPEWGSLAGRSEEEIDNFIRSMGRRATGAQPAPGPLGDTSAKLVNDASHPYRAPTATDIRGPCPGLNTLANHGYINRTGITNPQAIVNAVQNGFNMGNDLAILVTWGAHLVDGNQLTNLMSIGKKSGDTGAVQSGTYAPAGLNTHGVFEGDASTTRGDFYFGDNFSFNETLFQQLISASNQYGSGKYNAAAAAEVRWNRIQDSKLRNPNFDFTTPRYFTAYAESVFPFSFFVDGRDTSAALDLTSARSFIQTNKMPTNFYRRDGAFGIANVAQAVVPLVQAHYIAPGHNVGKANNYVTVSSDPGFGGGTCGIYTKHVNVTVPSLYPVKTTTGALLTALKANLVTFYKGAGSSCTQLFPYGK